MKLFVQVADKKYCVEIVSAIDRNKITVDGKEFTVDCSDINPGLGASLLVDNRSYTCDTSLQESNLKLHICSEEYEVSVWDERADAIRRMVGVKNVDTASLGDVHAPMPGLVVKILVEVGQQVMKGQGLVIVEAMKMENEIASPIDGTIRSLKVEAGRAVDKGQLLLVVGKE